MAPRPQLFGRRVVEPLDQFHSPLQQFPISHSAAGPALQDFVDPKSFLATESSVREICVVNHLSDCRDSRVPDSKHLRQRLKRAVSTSMTKSFAVKHVEGNGKGRNPFLRGKHKTRFRIDASSNEPRGRAAIHTRSRSGDPEPTLVFIGVYRGSRRRWLGSLGHAYSFQQLANPFLHGARKEIDLDDFLKTKP